VEPLPARAGSPQVIELHGNLSRVKCFQEDRLVDHWQETGEIPPRCPTCGGYLRPDVVWFGENLSPATLEMAFEAASNCEVFLSVGTSALVEPAASLPILAHRQGAALVEVNPQETPVTHLANFAIQGPAGMVLPALVEAVWDQTFRPPG
jgi:NAD-dependent deacetylase